MAATLPSHSRNVSSVCTRSVSYCVVVGDERLHGLGVEALELGGVLAHGGEQQPVGARVLEGQHLQRVVDVRGARLGDVGGQQRLVAGAVEIDRVVRDARVADREGEAVQRALELARDRLGDAADAVVGGLGDEHDDLAGALALRGDHGGERAGRARAGGALGGGEHARAPVVVAGGEVVRAHDDHGAALREVDAELLAAGDEVAAVGDVAARARRGRKAPWAASEARSGARRRSTSEAISVVMTRSSAAGGSSPPRARTRRRPTAVVADPQLVRHDPGRVGHQRALVGGRARGDREHTARAIDEHQGGVQRASRGAHDLGEPEPAARRPA